MQLPLFAVRLMVLQDYNIMTGAKFIADTLADNNGDVLETIGAYNGWTPGMTVVSAYDCALSGCRK